MPDLATLSPVIIAYLDPYDREDLRREFTPLARSVWEDEPLARGYYWLFPDKRPNQIIVIEIYNGEGGPYRHGTGDLTFDTFRRSRKHGLLVDMERMQNFKDHKPPPEVIKTEERGMVYETLFPVSQVKSFMGHPHMDSKQITTITNFTVKPANKAAFIENLDKLAEVAKKHGKVESFWVTEVYDQPDLVRLVTRFNYDDEEQQWLEDAEVKKLRASLDELAENNDDIRCKWAEQGFFLKKYYDDYVE